MSRWVTTMSDARDKAIEAAAKAMSDDWNPDRDPILTAMHRDYAASAIDAAIPHLLEPIEALADEYSGRSSDVDDLCDDLYEALASVRGEQP